MEHPDPGTHPREARIADLEAALATIAEEARLAGTALCETELLVRIENIARLAEAALPKSPARTGEVATLPGA